MRMVSVDIDAISVTQAFCERWVFTSLLNDQLSERGGRGDRRPASLCHFFRATDVAPVLLFIFHRFPANWLTNSNLSLIPRSEESHCGAVQPCMKAKHLLGLGVVIAVTGFAASAQAGTSFGISIGIPAYVQSAPYCSPPVVYCPPPVTYFRSPVVYVAPRCGPYYGHREYRDYRGHKGDHRHSGHNSRGYYRGGHR